MTIFAQVGDSGWWMILAAAVIIFLFAVINWLRVARRSAFTVKDCLSSEVLQPYVRGGFTPEWRKLIMEHLRDCLECREEAALLAEADMEGVRECTDLEERFSRSSLAAYARHLADLPFVNAELSKGYMTSLATHLTQCAACSAFVDEQKMELEGDET